MIVIQIPITPGRGRLIEVGGQRDEVGDAHLPIAIQIACQDEETQRKVGRERVAREIFDSAVNDCGRVVGIGQI